MTGWHSWQLSSSPPSGLVSCPLSHFSLQERLRRPFLLPLHMSFVYGDFSSLLAVGLGQLTLEQPEVSVTGTREKSVIMSCKVFSKDFSKDYIHWYRQKPDQGLEQLLYVSAAPALSHLGGTKNKLEAKKYASSSTSTLKISFLEKEDEAMYYCAGWVSAHSVGVPRITHTRTITRSVLTTSSTQAATEVAELGALPKPPTKESASCMIFFFF